MVLANNTYIQYEYERSSRWRYLTFVATALSNVRRDGVISRSSRRRHLTFVATALSNVRRVRRSSKAEEGSRPPQTPPFASTFGDTDGVI